MSENEPIVELAKRAKSSCIENRNVNGKEYVGDRALRTAVFELGTSPVLRVLSPQTYGDESYTRVALIDLSSPNVRADKLPSNLNKFVAIAIEHGVKNVDQSGRNGDMQHIIAFEKKDAYDVIRDAQNSPEDIFRLIRSLNNGPLRRFDGTPVEISTGKNLQIFPSETDKDDVIQSVDFPEGFNPNPLF